MSSSPIQSNGVKTLRALLVDVNPKALVKALEDLSIESNRKAAQFDEPLQPSDDEQQH